MWSYNLLVSTYIGIHCTYPACSHHEPRSWCHCQWGSRPARLCRVPRTPSRCPRRSSTGWTRSGSRPASPYTCKCNGLQNEPSGSLDGDLGCVDIMEVRYGMSRRWTGKTVHCVRFWILNWKLILVVSLDTFVRMPLRAQTCYVHNPPGIPDHSLDVSPGEVGHADVPDLALLLAQLQSLPHRHPHLRCSRGVRGAVLKEGLGGADS